MIRLEYNSEKVQFNKESYTYIDRVESVGGSAISLLSISGNTRLQQTRNRRDGKVTLHGLRLFTSYNQREKIRNMTLGEDKGSVSNPVLLTVSEGTERDRHKLQVVPYDIDTAYEENNIIENIDVVNGTPEEFGKTKEDVLYEIEVLFIEK